MTPTERERTTDELLEQALIYIDSLHEIIENMKAEHDKARNQAIQDCIDKLSSYRDIDRTQMKQELESLKTKP